MRALPLVVLAQLRKVVLVKIALGAASIGSTVRPRPAPEGAQRFVKTEPSLPSLNA
jgi:hypothetical protein